MLDALEILAQGASDGQVDGVNGIGVVWHAAFAGSMARFVILEAVSPRVNRWGEPLCLEVPQFGAVRCELPFHECPASEIDPRILIAMG